VSELSADAVRPPRAKLPARALEWHGPWQLCEYVTVGPKGKRERGKVWFRQYVVNDEHVECCRHIDHMTRPYKGAQSDGAES
jgi:hypothetical protein